MKFKFLLWMLEKLLKRAIAKKPGCATYVNGKQLTFQIQTLNGIGRNFTIRDGTITSNAGVKPNATFTMTFMDANSGFEILSAKNSKEAFLEGLHNQKLNLSGDFVEIMWFQGLTEFLSPAK